MPDSFTPRGEQLFPVPESRCAGTLIDQTGLETAEHSHQIIPLARVPSRVLTGEAGK